MRPCSSSPTACAEHLRTEQPAPGPAQAKRGELLYHIPHEMQAAHEYKCAVRVAYLRALLFEDWQAHADDVQKSIPVAEIMSVELLNQDSGEPFEIRSFSDTVQFLDQDFHTEWEFYVKPRRAGAYPLLLKISVVETRNGRDVKRNIVLEERVVVSTDAPLEVEAVFQKSDIILELRGEGRRTNGKWQVASGDKQTAEIPSVEPLHTEGSGSNPQTSNSRPLHGTEFFLFLKPFLEILQNPPKYSGSVLLFISIIGNICLYIHQRAEIARLSSEQKIEAVSGTGCKTAKDMTYDFLIARVLPMVNEAKGAPDGALRYSEALSTLPTFLKKANGVVSAMPKDSMLDASRRLQLESALEKVFEEAIRNPE